MRHRWACLMLAALLPAPLLARDMTRETVALREVVASAERPMKDIGVQQTAFDSTALKENISLSMSDVLTFHSSVFVKNHGRATLSTVAFRGTSPSHTQVTWNGLRLNSPMLGMTDFSTIPSYFVDKATLFHGSSSLSETGGGLGGLVSLSTEPMAGRGWQLKYVQGVGSFRTFDEFLHVGYAGERWQTSTRVVLGTSPNDFPYRNHDKKVLVYDENYQLVDSYYPKERNKSGSFRDLHVLQEVYFDTHRGDRFALNAWYTGTNRELPMLTTDYGWESAFENRQREHTLRSVLSWRHSRTDWNLEAKGGYLYTWMAYDYRRDTGSGTLTDMTRSRSWVNTFFGQGRANWNPSDKWLLEGQLSVYQHLVRSEDNNIIRVDGNKAIVGYYVGRFEVSGSLTARWRPVERLGLSLVLREELAGSDWAPPMPAFFVDGLLSRRGNLVAKASVSRNFRFPTLNDLYFLPGGNPDLKSEKGYTADLGLSFQVGEKAFRLGGSANVFDSRINDWIQWLPTSKGFFTPRNVGKVHSYGVETRLDMCWAFARDWQWEANAHYSWTPSVNVGEPASPADQSVGRQLPYVPRHAAAFNGRLAWRRWALQYKWCWYSQRYTMSSNQSSLSGHLPPYFMNNIVVEKSWRFAWADLQLKLAVNNLFNEEYLSVLSRPMPGINFEAFAGLQPRFKTKR